MENESTATQVVEGVSGQAPESQVQAPVSQETGPEQNTAPVKVETQDSQASSHEETRRSPSAYVQDRREIRRLRDTVNQLQNTLQSLQQIQPQTVSPAQTQKQGFDVNKFFTNPQEVLQQMLDEREARLKGEIPRTLEQYNVEKQFESSRQEARKLIETNEAIKRDPSGMDKILDIITDNNYGIDEISKLFPVQAARLALELYNLRNGGAQRRNANAPSRGQMMSTATTVNSNGKQPTLQDESTKLQQELMQNPTLAYDPAFQARIQALKQRRVSNNNQ